MGLLQPYNGKYYNAESASNRLDIEAIYAGCDAVDQEASNIGNLNNKINNISSNLDVNSFSLNGDAIVNVSDDCCSDISTIKASILDATSQIRSACEGAYNNLQSQLNYDAQIRDQYEINRLNNSRR